MSSSKSTDPLDRLINRALRERPDELPENFAAQTAAFVEAETRHNSDRLESWLQRALVAALMIATVVAWFMIGAPALAELASLPSVGWIWTAALCLSLSLAMQRLVVVSRKN